MKGRGVSDRFQNNLMEGARNLLINCAKCRPGQRLLIVYETEEDGYYDPELARAIMDVARDIGLITELFGVPLIRDVTKCNAHLAARTGASDCTLFLARLGDQIRFRPKGCDRTQIVSYALDREMLASPFGRVRYQAFDQLKGLLNHALAGAQDIHVTCPAGTDFSGQPKGFSHATGDTTLKRFPVLIFAPVPARGFSGRIAQAGFLTGTGSRYYTPMTCEIKETLFVQFDGDRITGFEGAAADVARARAHYEFVAQKYGLDAYYVHSWHGGIHPGMMYKDPAAANFERWGGSAFGNPRLMHFHTCGAFPPGEISLNILDPTVRIDGVAVWENGRLYPERIAGGADLLAAYPDMADVFEHPATQVGQAACGRLAYA